MLESITTSEFMQFLLDREDLDENAGRSVLTPKNWTGPMAPIGSVRGGTQNGKATGIHT